MNINTTKKALAGALAATTKVVPTRSSNPALTQLRLRATHSGLELSGTNLNVDVRLALPAEIGIGAQDVDVVLPAHLFEQIVRNLGSELVSLELRGHEIAVRASGSDFKLQLGDPALYPELAFDHQGEVLTLYGEAFARAVDAVEYASATEAFQAVFRGVLLDATPARVRLAASDGFRLAVYDIPETNGPTLKAIIPAGALRDLARATKGAERLDLSVHDGALTVTAPNIAYRVKLMDGDFPPYERVIPKDLRAGFACSAATLRESLARVGILADKNANNRVELLLSEDRLRLNAEGDYGRAEDTLDVAPSGPDGALSLGVNSKYLLEALAPIRGDAQLSFSGSTTPFALRDASDEGLLAVVVPLRV